MNRKMNCVLALALILGFSFCCLDNAACAELALYVSASKQASADVPVHATIELPREFANVPADQISVVLREAGAAKTVPASPGQIVIGANKETQLWWILPHARALSTSMWVATLERQKGSAEQGFAWKDAPGKHLDLLFGDRKITSYMYAYDTSTDQSTYETYKPFHHVFDAQGRLLTNGPDGVNPFPRGGAMRYVIHRGILTGWHFLYQGREYNFWGMENGVYIRHQKFMEEVSGPVLAKSGSLTHWNDKSNKTIIVEQRHITVFRTADPTIMLAEFRVVLEPAEGEIFLIADREHGGLQFRAHNDVAVAPAKSEGKATFLLPEEGSNAETDLDIPWAAMTYGLNGHWYGVQLMNDPQNPKPTLFSAYRDYGRLGACTQLKIRAGQPLTLKYRVWVIEGKTRDRAEYSGNYGAFVNPPEVRVYSYTSDKTGRMLWGEKYQ